MLAALPTDWTDHREGLVMADNAEIPEAFGGSWEAFCQRWCREGDLAHSRAEVSLGLRTLERLWPEELARIAGQSQGGTSAPALCIEKGLQLAACEGAPYFTAVFNRLKAGQRSAYSELVVGEALRALGYAFHFEAGDGQADLVGTIGGQPVAFEVYAPDDSFASQQQSSLVQDLRNAISDAIGSSRVELEICDLFDKTRIETAVKTICAATSLRWLPIESWAMFRRTYEGEVLAPDFDGDGAQMRIAGDTDRKGTGKSVVIRWAPVDMRARHALERKRAQVREGIGNVVVFDVCAVGGVRDWPEVIAKLPGTDFEKIGAVLSFDQGSVGPPERIRRRWRCVLNPNATLPIAEEFISAVESLDESRYYGIPTNPRLAFNSGENTPDTGLGDNARVGQAKARRTSIQFSVSFENASGSAPGVDEQS
jgi:hypothetical protein